jgi:TM2 domain-containing membrane protein YozV
MSRNVGTLDQAVRSLLGFALFAFVMKDGTVMPGSGLTALTAIYLFITGLFMYCPLYGLLGLSTSGRLDRSA